MKRTRTLTTDEVGTLRKRFPDAPREMEAHLRDHQIPEEDIEKAMAAAKFPNDILQVPIGSRSSE